MLVMNKIRVAVVGVGHLGSLHARIYKDSENCLLAGVSDIDQARLNEASQSLMAPGCQDYRELFGRVDAVSIAVPTKLHYKIAAEFLKHKIHALVEKPFTASLKEADALIKLAQKNKVILAVGHIERFNSAFSATQKLINRP
ncbi:MAG: Gfo/Idh/MocA family oxidoreductase, partial [Candidatus Omnitrophota bacterium]